MGLSPPLRPERDTKSLARFAITSHPLNPMIRPLLTPSFGHLATGEKQFRQFPIQTTTSSVTRNQALAEITQTTFYTKRN